MSSMKISIQELIEIAKSKSEKIQAPKQFINDVHRYLSFLKVKNGRHWVKRDILYQAYKLWSNTPVNEKEFFLCIADLIYVVKRGRWRYYRLNYRPLELLNKSDNLKLKV